MSQSRNIVAICFLASTLALPLFAQNFSSAIRFGVVDAFQITEASGLAASRQNPGVLWTHNDNH